MSTAPTKPQVPPWLPGVIPWAIGFVAVAIMVIDNPERSLGPLYGGAVDAWWGREALYQGHWGMNYLPHFAVLYGPFHLLGEPAGEIVWRAVATVWLAAGLWQLFRIADREQAGTYFFWGSLLALPICMGAIRNGQANAIFAAATVQAVVCLVRRQWWLAAAMLVLAVVLKPLGLVLLLLAPVVYKPLLPRLPVALLAFAALPFLFGPPAYVAGQHEAFARNMRDCAAAPEHRFDNMNGILRTLGVEPAAGADVDPELIDGAGRPHLSTGLSLLAALATLAIWWLGARRTEGLARGLLLLSLATSYLMLFNPMNEGNSYVIIAPAMAVMTVLLLQVDRDRPLGWVLVATTLSIGVAVPALYPVAPTMSSWWFPTATLVFVAVLLVVLRRGDPAGPVSPSPGRGSWSAASVHRRG